jgi:TRAP-type C4-dicarboxylate transport system permease small subunit
VSEQTQSISAEVDPRELVQGIPEPEMKWGPLNLVERGITVICGAILVGFTTAVLVDVVTRSLGTPISGLQNFVLGSFVWGIFLGAAVAQRRREHFRLAAIAEHFTGFKRKLFETLENTVVIAVAVWMVWFGYGNVQTGMHNYLQPSEVPLAAVTASIPVSGALILLFCVERLYHVWTLGAEFGRPGEARETERELADKEVGRGE